jgi:hypothetical protein
MKALRDGVTSAAGGEAEATHALLERHVAERLEYYRINHNLVTASDWRVGARRTHAPCCSGAPPVPAPVSPLHALLPDRSPQPSPQVYAPKDLPLHSIPGGKMMYQLASAEHNGMRYAVVALGIANPFLFDNLRSLLLHWGCSEGASAGWAQPPKGWHTSPGVSTVRRRRGGGRGFVPSGAGVCCALGATASQPRPLSCCSLIQPA